MCGTFIDLRKPFDTVNHDILLDKLNYYGVKGISNMWLVTFLKERYQYATIKEYNSEKLMSTNGLPQGSVLGPLLFLLLLATYIKRPYIAPDTTLQTISTFYQLKNLLKS